jgi:hypothetical protein
MSESAGVLGAKNNLIFWLKRNNEVLTIAPESNSPSVLHPTLLVAARKPAQSPFRLGPSRELGQGPRAGPYGGLVSQPAALWHLLSMAISGPSGSCGHRQKNLTFFGSF